MMSKKHSKSHTVQLRLRLVVKDPDGKVISDTGDKPSKSFVVAFLVFIGGIFDGIDTNIEDTSNVPNLIVQASGTNYPLQLDSPINNSDYGIVVGTGNTVEDNEDYKLDVQLTEGIGAGDITHGAMTIGSAGVVGPNVDIEAKRPFVNNTGSAITVAEAGMYVKRFTKYFCIVRDVLASSVNLPDKCSLMVYYTIRTTV